MGKTQIMQSLRLTSHPIRKQAQATSIIHIELIAVNVLMTIIIILIKINLTLINLPKKHKKKKISNLNNISSERETAVNSKKKKLVRELLINSI